MRCRECRRMRRDLASLKICLQEAVAYPLDWNDEKRAEYERRVTGKILNAAWRGSKFEIQSVLRDVCDSVLYDKKVPLSKRLERAQALVLVGDIFSRVSFNSQP